MREGAVGTLPAVHEIRAAAGDHPAQLVEVFTVVLQRIYAIGCLCVRLQTIIRHILLPLQYVRQSTA